MGKFFKGLGKAIKSTGTTAWGATAAVAYTVSQNPAILGVIIHDEHNLEIGIKAAQLVTAIAVGGLGKKAMDATSTPSK